MNRKILFVVLAICTTSLGSLHGQMTIEKLEVERKKIDAKVMDRWPDHISALRVDKVKAEAPGLFKTLAGLDDAAVDADLPDEDTEWINQYSLEIAQLEKVLENLQVGYRWANKYENEMHAFGDEDLDEIFKDAITTSEAKNTESNVNAAFESVRAEASSAFKSLSKMQKKAVARLSAAHKWKPEHAAFRDLKRAMARLIKQSVNRMVDAHDKVREDPAFRAALEGDKSNICGACRQGRFKEAENMLKSWRPVKLDMADDLSDKLKQIPRESGWIDVIAHGNPDKIIIVGDGRQLDSDQMTIFKILKKELDAEDLSEWRKVHRNSGVGLRLLSCNTGRAPSGYAQQLANYVGVKVKAPTKKLCLVRYDGRLHVILHDCTLCNTYKKKADRLMHRINSKDRGQWKTFTPNDDAAEAVRDDLVELAKQEKWWRIHLTEVKLKKSWEDTMKALHRINPRLKTVDIEYLMKRDGKLVFMDKITQRVAIDKLNDLEGLGFKAHCEAMPKYDDEFKGIDIDD